MPYFNWFSFDKNELCLCPQMYSHLISQSVAIYAGVACIIQLSGYFRRVKYLAKFILFNYFSSFVLILTICGPSWVLSTFSSKQPVISLMAHYQGWVGGKGMGWVVGVGGQPKAGYTFHQDTDSSAVSSVSDRNRLNPQDMSRQSLAAVWYPSHPY